MAFEEKTIKSEVLYKGPIFTLKRDEIIDAAGKHAGRDIVVGNGAVAVAAITPEGKLLLIRQYRKAAEQVLWEIPAGKIEDDEVDRKEEAALRELREETGWQGRDLRKLIAFYASAGYSTEIVYLYRVDACAKGDTDFDEGESIDLYEVELSRALEMVRSGEIIDAKTIIAILLLVQEL